MAVIHGTVSTKLSNGDIVCARRDRGGFGLIDMFEVDIDVDVDVDIDVDAGSDRLGSDRR